MARAHRDVGHPEVPELLRRRGFVALVEKPFDLREVLVDHRFKGSLQEMFDGELGREVRARRLSFPRAVVEVDLARLHHHFVARSGRPVGVLPVHSEIDFGAAQFGFEEALIDRSELPYRQRSKVHGTDFSARRLVDEQIA